jgi:hypothetical protein
MGLDAIGAPPDQRRKCWDFCGLRAPRNHSARFHVRGRTWPFAHGQVLRATRRDATPESSHSVH